MNQTEKILISFPIGKVFYTSMSWRDDKKRKSLFRLKKLGFFKQVGRFAFLRIDKKINQ